MFMILHENTQHNTTQHSTTQNTINITLKENNLQQTQIIQLQQLTSYESKQLEQLTSYES